jgi:YjbE family integral membrane protein
LGCRELRSIFKFRRTCQLYFETVTWFYADTGRLLAIIATNLMLSGDNALAVGLVVRKLPLARQKIAMSVGITAAMVLQIAATLTVASILKFPPVALVAGVLLAAVAIRLLRNDFAADPLSAGQSASLLRSIAMVIGAYLLMSLDNIVAVASIGVGAPLIVCLGLLLSCVVLVFCGLLITTLMERYPLIVKLVAGLLGWRSGTIIAASLRFVTGTPYPKVVPFLLPPLVAALVISSPWWRPKNSIERKHAAQL